MTTELRFCPVGTIVKLCESLAIGDDRRIYTDRELTVVHPGTGPVEVGPQLFATVEDEDGNRYRVHPAVMVRPVCRERPPLRSWCIVKGHPLVMGRAGRIVDLYTDNGTLRATVWFPGSPGHIIVGSQSVYPAAFLDWWKADCDDTKGGGKALPARPKNWREYANVLA